MFDISFSANLGKVFLAPYTESFEPNFSTWSKEAYEQQWLAALDFALNKREPSAFFYNVDLNDQGVGLLWLYGCIPTEIAGENDTHRGHLEDYPERDDAGVYITEQFKLVTIDPSVFLSDQVYADFPMACDRGLYFLDLKHPDRFYGFVNSDLAGVSHWYYPNSDMVACRNRIAERCGKSGRNT